MPSGRANTAGPTTIARRWSTLQPLIDGIAWAGELIGRAGAEDVFVDLHPKRAAMLGFVFA